MLTAMQTSEIPSFSLMCTDVLSVVQVADKTAGANRANLSLRKGKPIVKQRFQPGSVDEVCFLGKTPASPASNNFSDMGTCPATQAGRMIPSDVQVLHEIQSQP